MNRIMIQCRQFLLIALWLLFQILPALAESSIAAAETDWISLSPVSNVGPCNVDDWKKDFSGCKFEDGVAEGHLAIIKRGSESVFRISCAAGGIGPEKGGVGWRWPFPSSGQTAQLRRTAELRYEVYFEPGFEFVKGGKLPGLCGGPKTITGGDQCTGFDGWSVRVMWRREGRAQAYVYHPRMKARYGDEFDFPPNFRFPVGQAVQLRIAVTMNDLDQANGALRVWARLAGQSEQLMVEQLAMQWTKDQQIGVDSLLFNVFHGGNDSSWAPSKDCAVCIGPLAYR